MKNDLKAIRLVMADDHEIFRDGFRLTLSKAPGIQLIAEASNGKELVSTVNRVRPDVVITDIKMPIMDGIEATRQLHKSFPELGIIGLSMFDEDDLILEMLEAGGRGYLLKNADKAEVLEAIKTVFNNQQYFCNQTSAKLALLIARSEVSKRMEVKIQPHLIFAEKELEVVRLICREFTAKEIAELLFLSPRTVEGYRLRIQEKMHVKNIAGLVIYAIKHGIFDPEQV